MASETSLAPFETIKTRFKNNVDRVTGLVELYKLADSEEFRKKNKHSSENVRPSDILRSAVVFLHATLEDALRGLLRWKLPTAAVEHFDNLKFRIGTDQKDSIRVAHLAVHRGRQVDDLLGDVIENYLDYCSFSNIGDLDKAVKKLGFKNSQQFGGGTLASLMRRRHQIVHESDRAAANDRDHGKPQKISPQEVGRWALSVLEFVNAVFKAVEQQPHIRQRLKQEKVTGVAS